MAEIAGNSFSRDNESDFRSLTVIKLGIGISWTLLKVAILASPALGKCTFGLFGLLF